MPTTPDLLTSALGYANLGVATPSAASDTRPWSGWLDWIDLRIPFRYCLKGGLGWRTWRNGTNGALSRPLSRQAIEESIDGTRPRLALPVPNTGKHDFLAIDLDYHDRPICWPEVKDLVNGTEAQVYNTGRGVLIYWHFDAPVSVHRLRESVKLIAAKIELGTLDRTSVGRYDAQRREVVPDAAPFPLPFGPTVLSWPIYRLSYDDEFEYPVDADFIRELRARMIEALPRSAVKGLPREIPTFVGKGEFNRVVILAGLAHYMTDDEITAATPASIANRLPERKRRAQAVRKGDRSPIGARVSARSAEWLTIPLVERLWGAAVEANPPTQRRRGDELQEDRIATCICVLLLLLSARRHGAIGFLSRWRAQSLCGWNKRYGSFTREQRIRKFRHAVWEPFKRVCAQVQDEALWDIYPGQRGAMRLYIAPAELLALLPERPQEPLPGSSLALAPRQRAATKRTAPPAALRPTATPPGERGAHSAAVGTCTRRGPPPCRPRRPGPPVSAGQLGLLRHLARECRLISVAATCRSWWGCALTGLSRPEASEMIDMCRETEAMATRLREA